jgi:UDPglucose 6-dehydrogenase
MRDAPSLVILPLLGERGAIMRVYDPQGRKQAEPLLGDVAWCANAMEAIEGADAVLVLTEWNEFRALDLRRMKARMRGNVMIDLRNVFRPSLATENGFHYTGIGRSPSEAVEG